MIKDQEESVKYDKIDDDDDEPNVPEDDKDHINEG